MLVEVAASAVMIAMVIVAVVLPLSEFIKIIVGSVTDVSCSVGIVAIREVNLAVMVWSGDQPAELDILVK